jgi:hypothetical protein
MVLTLFCSNDVYEPIDRDASQKSITGDACCF